MRVNCLQKIKTEKQFKTGEATILCKRNTVRPHGIITSVYRGSRLITLLLA